MEDAAPFLGKPRFRTPVRNQMFFDSLDSSIRTDHPVRAVWEVAKALDFAAFEIPIKAREGNCGRDANPPCLLAALWIYSTIKGITSARELDRLCKESKPFLWLCGGISVNYHTLSDFRVGHKQALDNLLTQTIAMLVHKGLVDVERISQDGLRIRAGAGAASFRRQISLEEALAQAREQVRNVQALLDDPARSAELSAGEKAAQERAARERLERVEEAIVEVKKLQARQEEAKRDLSPKQIEKLKEPRASTTDADARTMKMPDSGFRAAFNAQFAVDTKSRAIVGVEVVNEGVDGRQSEPMRQQVEQRTGLEVKEHLADGGYTNIENVEAAAADGVEMFCPPKPPRNPEKNGDEFQPRKGDSPAILAWRERMGSARGKAIYKERAATSETVNADLRELRGLDKMRVRGLPKVRCLALWAALAYQVVHFAPMLIG